MTELLEQTPPPSQAPATTDLATAVQQALAGSSEPMTVPKLRSRLPAPFRHAEPQEITDILQRLVAANVIYQYPKYRSPQDRYWDRSMPVHIAALLREALQDGPLPWWQLRRRLPAYAQGQAQAVLEEQLAQGMLHRHPRAGGRDPERFGLRPADPRDYLRQELPPLFTRLSALGFSRAQLRAAALELLHDEEWDAAPPEPEPEKHEPTGQAPAEATYEPPLAGPHEPAVMSSAAVAENTQQQGA